MGPVATLLRRPASDGDASARPAGRFMYVLIIIIIIRPDNPSLGGNAIHPTRGWIRHVFPVRVCDSLVVHLRQQHLCWARAQRASSFFLPYGSMHEPLEAGCMHVSGLCFSERKHARTHAMRPAGARRSRNEPVAPLWRDDRQSSLLRARPRFSHGT
jgi:hypothetical protein